MERRFAQRIDTIPRFQRTTPAQFYAESQRVAQISRHTEDLLRLGFDIFEDGRISMGPHQGAGNRLAPIVVEFLKDLGGSHGERDRAALKARFTRNLIFETKVDLNNVNPAALTGYHRVKLEEEIKTRGKIREAFEELASIQQGDNVIQLR